MADNDGKLYIIITDQPVVNSTQTITENTTTTEEPQKNKQIKTTQTKENSNTYNFAAHQFYNLVTQTATEIVNWSISNIGNFSGDYIKQANVQKAIGLTSKILGIGMAAFHGGMAGGPIGALVAGTVALVGTGVSIALEDRANSFQVQKQNREIAQLRELSGLNPLTNGGRI